MRIGFDEWKRQSNLSKHQGLDFADLDRRFFDQATVTPAKFGRLLAVGPFRQELISVIFVRLGSEGFSIVSMRRASRNERRRYEERTL